MQYEIFDANRICQIRSPTLWHLYALACAFARDATFPIGVLNATPFLLCEGGVR